MDDDLRALRRRLEAAPGDAGARGALVQALRRDQGESTTPPEAPRG